MAPPPLPARRRKKSQKPGEETESVDTPEHSPIKEYFSSSSFQAKIEKLGNLARRISRDAARHSDDKTSVSSSRKSSAIQSPRSSKDSSSRKPSLTQQPTPRSSKDGGTVSRKSSSIYIESSASPPVFFLENSPKSTIEVDDDVSFCWYFELVAVLYYFDSTQVLPMLLVDSIDLRYLHTNFDQNVWYIAE